MSCIKRPKGKSALVRVAMVSCKNPASEAGGGYRRHGHSPLQLSIEVWGKSPASIKLCISLVGTPEVEGSLLSK